MDERAALLRAVCENPDDDTPRLVFADWLQENGEEARAEFIRLQIEMARAAELSSRVSALTTRQHQLLRLHEQRWRAEELLQSEKLRWGRFERGFVELLTVSDTDYFCRVADAVFSSAPVTSLGLQFTDDFAGVVELPHLARLAHLTIWFRRPTAESVRRLADTPYLSAVETLAILGPTIDFALEDVLVERFGPKLFRGSGISGV